MTASDYIRNQLIFGQTQSPSIASITSGTISGVDISALSLKILEGINGRMGVATLVAGTVTVNNTSITANSRIFLTAQAGVLNIGVVSVTSRVVGASFTITSLNALDTRTIAYQIFEPA